MTQVVTEYLDAHLIEKPFDIAQVTLVERRRAAEIRIERVANRRNLIEHGPQLAKARVSLPNPVFCGDFHEINAGRHGLGEIPNEWFPQPESGAVYQAPRPSANFSGMKQGSQPSHRLIPPLPRNFLYVWFMIAVQSTAVQTTTGVAGAMRFGKSGKRLGARRRTPLVLQTHATECGAACLASILGYFGRWLPFGELRTICKVSRDGASADDLSRAAKHCDLKCVGYRLNAGQLRGLRLPLILWWECRHFVVLEGWRGDWFYVNDPALGRRKISAEDFHAGFSKVALEFEPGEGFAPGGDKPGLLRRLPVWLEGSWGGVAFISACSLLLSCLMLAPAAVLGVFIDHVLGAGLPWRDALIGVLLAAAAAAYGVSWLQATWLQRLKTRIAVNAGNDYLTHFLRLPLEFFRHRVSGDLVSRLRSTNDIARTLGEQLIGAALEGLMCLVFLAAMLTLQPLLALVLLALGVLHVSLLLAIMRWRDDYSQVWRSEHGKLAGAGAMMMEQLSVLRGTGAEDNAFRNWSANQAREVSSRQQMVEYSHFAAALAVLFIGLSVAAVLGFGSAAVMSGQMTLGGLLGFLIIAGLFMRPMSRFAGVVDDWQDLGINLQRLDDIFVAPRDPAFDRAGDTGESSAAGGIATLDGRLRLTGRIEIRDITFGYVRGGEPLIRNFSLTVEPGQRVALVGPSGSGKSTLGYLIAGLYQPWSGAILFDGRPLEQIPTGVWQRSLAMVDQEAVLFSGTVRENITLWNRMVPDEALTAAARDARIHEEIIRRPLGYESEIEDGGGNFSGGQRQRLEIARALLNDPKVLVLDEATNALDAITEAQVDRALRRRGCTCLIIAHRLNTIRDSDEIIVFDKAGIAQRGTHDELIRNKEGRYYRLVHSG